MIMADENGKPIYDEPTVLKHSAKVRTGRDERSQTKGPANHQSTRLDPTTQPTDKSKDVTCVEWSRDGERVLTGCYDGVARVWNRDGTLEHSLASHEGAIFALRWSPSVRGFV